MPKILTAGSEVDSYCTKCKLDLNHRIISMDGDKVFKVECLTCRGHHKYRRPKSAEPPKKRVTKRATEGKVAKPKAIDQLKKAWEQAILGSSPTDFTSYRIDQQLAQGQLIRHKKFGDGVVNEVIDPGKAEVLFEDGPRTLAHGRV